MDKREQMTAQVPAETNLVDSVDALVAKMAQVREAQRKFSTFTQEQVDQIFFAAAMAANQQRIPLAKMAVEETGMGVVEDKSSRTIMLPNISTINIGIPRPAAS